MPFQDPAARRTPTQRSLSSQEPRCQADACAAVAFLPGARPTACRTTSPVVRAPVAASPAPSSQTPSILLILDASSSMLEEDGAGHRKIDTAKSTLNGLIDSLPRGAPVGLRVYGARIPDTDKANGCTDTQLLAPVGPLEPAAMKAVINTVQATGFTPIATSLDQAQADLPAQGERTIVLVSDGQETCDRDPCQVVRDLVAKGIKVRVDTVGFQVDGAARQQLECIAQATGGEYHDAANAAELASSLQSISTRALRSYQTVGGVIQGGGSFNDAPVVQPGQYQDSLKTNESLYYAICLAEGQVLHATATLVGQPDLALLSVADRFMGFRLAISDPQRRSVDFHAGVWYGSETDSRSRTVTARQSGVFYVAVLLAAVDAHPAS